MIGALDDPKDCTCAALVLAATGGAVAVRAALTLAFGAGAPVVGVIFAATLAVVVAAAGWTPGRPRLRDAGVGGAGGLVLIAFPVVFRSLRAQPITGSSLHITPEVLVWFAVVTMVAIAEEALFRGVLFDLAGGRTHAALAVTVTAAAFGLMHVPFYGWGALPIDVAAGIWLGALRDSTNSWTAPAVAHVVADWAAWVLR